ncbi:MAG: hypothetical protein WD512_06990 [Candidatus Paceibacterota bacterium]
MEKGWSNNKNSRAYKYVKAYCPNGFHEALFLCELAKNGKNIPIAKICQVCNIGEKVTVIGSGTHLEIVKIND